MIGAIKTNAVYVFATPKIDITASENPKKFEPVSPINVLAGLKLYGKNPEIAPPNAVISTIAITGEPFNVNIISNDIQEIKLIPEDNPSSPSIKLIAFVTPTIQQTVIIYDKTILSSACPFKNGISKFSILMPQATTTSAAIICTINLVMLCIPFVSSIKQVIPKIIIPIKKPTNLSHSWSSVKSSIFPSMLILIKR